MRPISKFPFALYVSVVLGQLLSSDTSTDISTDISTDTSTVIPTDPLTEPSIGTSTTTDELVDGDSSTVSSSFSTTDPEDLIVSETSSDSPSISTETPTVTTDDLSTPSPTDSLQAASTIPGDLYLADADAEPDIKAKEPSPDEVVDLAAYEVDTYAQRLAAGQQSVPEVPDPEAQVVLPVCPDVSASTKILEKRQNSLPVFGCSPERLSVRVHFVHVAPGFYLSDKPLEDVKQRAITNFAFLRDVMARLGIDLFFGSYTSDINPAFSDNQFGDSQANIRYRTKTRKGDSDSLTVWIVDNITDPADPTNGNPAGYSSFPNDGGSGPTAYDGLVVQQVALSPLNQKSLADAVYTIEAKKQCTLTGEKDLLKIQGSTLIHEFGHWMGLIHTHEGGCSGTGDRVADTNQVADSTTRSCCYQATCNKVASFRVKNWMSYSSCRGISLKGNPFFYDAFTEGQRSRMFSHFLKYRQRRQCSAPKKRDTGSLPTSPGQAAALRKRDEQGAIVMADLLLNNCSVAIQDVFEPDSIPLDQKVLESYSSQASSLQANPTSLPPGVERPPTLTGATAQPTETGEGDSTGEEDDDSGAMAGVSFSNRGSMMYCIAWMAWLLFG